MDWLAVAIEEYRTLRQEALDALHEQTSVQQFGLAAIGVLLAAGLQARGDTALAVALLLGFVPVAAMALLVMWTVAYGRMARVGMQLARLEAEISDRFPGEPWPLSWERGGYGRRRRPKITRPRAVAALFATLAAAGTIAGAIVLGRFSPLGGGVGGAGAATLVFRTLQWFGGRQSEIDEDSELARADLPFVADPERRRTSGLVQWRAIDFPEQGVKQPAEDQSRSD